MGAARRRSGGIVNFEDLFSKMADKAMGQKRSILKDANRPKEAAYELTEAVKLIGINKKAMGKQ